MASPLFVQKFGGSSVGTLERINQVADIVTQNAQTQARLVVVVSAMQGETNRLVDLTAAFPANTPTAEREKAIILSTGERVSAALLAMALQQRGIKAQSCNAFQAGIHTDAAHCRARITHVDTQRLNALIDKQIIPVVTGFQGVNPFGELTTLARGGSDITAVVLADALNADECQIYTDVEGVYTSDPRVVADAKRIANISFDEMIELSRLGAKVLHRHAVEYANQHAVAVRVLSTFQPGQGTLITTDLEDTGEPVVSGIAFDRHQAKLTIVGIPRQLGYPTALINAVNQAAIDIDMEVHHPAESLEQAANFSFTVPKEDYSRALSIAELMLTQLPARQVIGNNQVSKLSLVGRGITTHASIATKMLKALSAQRIDIYLITSSAVKISVLIDQADTDLAAQTLHKAFKLNAMN